jgi:hypothetical protein
MRYSFATWYLVGTHPNPNPATAGTCKECQQVLMALFELADCAVPIRTSEAPPRTGHNFGKLTRFSGVRGCTGEVYVAIWLFRWEPFERARNGWAEDFIAKTTKFLLDHGCRPVLEDRTKAEKLACGGCHPFETDSLVPPRVA